MFSKASRQPATTEQISLDAMNDSDLRSAYAAQDAAEALVALGWPVRAAEDESETWRIGYVVLTDSDLIRLAARRGIRPAAERVQ